MYCLQKKSFELGNFINCTPTLRSLFERKGKPFPVYFENEYLKQGYENCGFIKILDEPEGQVLFGSNDINDKIPDWKYCYEKVNRITRLNPIIPHTYIDKVDLMHRRPKFDYCAVIRGCLTDQPNKVIKKDPGDEIYIKIITGLLKFSEVIFVGTEIDRKRSEKLFNYFGLHLHTYNTCLSDALGLINHSKYVVGNDTGLMHVAGAYQKRAFCMWKDTIFEKNRTPSEQITYSFDWEKDFKKWILL